MQSLHCQIIWESYLAVATKTKNAQTLLPNNPSFKNLSFKSKRARIQRYVYKDFYFDNICSAKTPEIA